MHARLVSCTASFCRTSLRHLWESTTNEEMASKFNIIAHRGHRSVAPENTLAAFQAALSEGYSHFELDAQLSSDGCCIVIHDDDLDRTTDGSGRVGEVRQSCSSGMTCTCSYSRDRTNRRAFGMHGVEPVCSRTTLW